MTISNLGDTSGYHTLIGLSDQNIVGNDLFINHGGFNTYSSSTSYNLAEQLNQ